MWRGVGEESGPASGATTITWEVTHVEQGTRARITQPTPPPVDRTESAIGVHWSSITTTPTARQTTPGRCPVSARRGVGDQLTDWGSATGDEHVLSAVVLERLATEAAIERLELKAGDIKGPEPFVLGCPPQ